MPRSKLVLYRNKKEVWILVVSLGLIALLNSPIADKAPLFLMIAYQGDGTTLNGYKIHTGFDYIFNHDEYLGGVSVQKVASNFKAIDWSYYLKFEEGTSKEIEQISAMCKRPISNCETISFDNFVGVNVGTYIEVNDEIINLTVYYNPDCDVFIRHNGNPFDQVYLEMVNRFFNDNCVESNS